MCVCVCVFANLVVPQHVGKSGLSCIIEAQEQYTCLLVPKTNIAEDVKHPVEHGWHKCLSTQNNHEVKPSKDTNEHCDTLTAD